MPLGHDLFYRQFDWMLSRPTGKHPFLSATVMRAAKGAVWAARSLPCPEAEAGRRGHIVTRAEDLRSTAIVQPWK